ncbi:MAG: hypothetical protein HY549_01760 [Elusimicrobia bacterium]|nr:hypothetical protein [Elusimicrobiota bacterium]
MKPLLATLPAVALLAGCSLKTMALRSTAALLDEGAMAFYEEPDPAFARETLGAQLKLVEALLRNDPGDVKLLDLAAQGFGGYSFLFFEEEEPPRAKGFYLRGRDYALRALRRRRGALEVERLELQALERELKGAGRAELPSMFWAAFNWAGWINLSKDSSEAVADLPKAVALMRRALELDPQYHFGGPDLFFGVYYASRPAILGGDLKKAARHFSLAKERANGKFLMSYVLEARYYAVAAQDQALFKSLLTRALELPSGALPGARLSDEMAKRRAETLLRRIDEFF